MSEHKCFESADEQLGKKNTKLAFGFVFPTMEPRLIVGTVKADDKKRGKPVTLFANFCPFCGVHLQ